MKNRKAWTLPDGSEIRIEEGKGITTFETEDGIAWTIHDPELAQKFRAISKPGESPEQTLSRIMEERLRELRDRPEWEQDPDRWKHNDNGEG
jgi:dTDP-4-amino-4,6-dideoxygalactose transaminase